jgi:hypothetical protein
MTTLPVTFACYHLTEVEGITWRAVDFRVRALVKSMKQETFGGYTVVNVNGTPRRFDNTNAEELVGAVLRGFGLRLREQLQKPITLVPIPSSNMSINAKGPFRSVTLAQFVAVGYGAGATVVPAIRWDSAKNKAHLSKQYRHPGLFQPHMRLVEKPAGSIVLFDDVMTSGSQMIAAARLLAENCCPPERGFVAARATKVQHEKPIDWRAEDLEIDPESDDLEF